MYLIAISKEVCTLSDLSLLSYNHVSDWNFERQTLIIVQLASMACEGDRHIWQKSHLDVPVTKDVSIF